ncbi:hypothetical protein OSB04_005698 [Centaurea solstitialis]|uniref:CCHC-type domain-containing protein n=1 Tax=Centaurea solstitialis TaxID=347529 RepID=A0AA38TP58_9ASTR|nr:hypothetical protein OSB04_005698 [Centaurea solstitialis]
MASTVTNTNNLSLRSILEKDKLTGSSFLDWERNLMIVLRHERKWYVLEEPLGEAPPTNAPAAARNAHKKHSDDLLDVACLMLATMSLDLQAGLINTNAYDMIRQLRDMFQTQARTECYDATKAFNECKMVKGTSVSDHIMKMKRHLDHLERLGHPVPLQLATDTILNSLSEDYRPFVVNYNMNNMEKSIAELHSMLKTAELNLGNKNKTKDVLMVRDGGVKKKNGHASTSKGKGPVQAVQSAPKKGKGKGKGKKVKPNKARTENRCFTCNEVGHRRQNCPKRQRSKWNLFSGSYDQLLNNSYKRCRLKVAQIFDRVANIGRDPRLRLLLGISHKAQFEKMLSIRRFHGRISQQFLLDSSSSFFIRLLHSSITDDEPHLMVDYLIHSLNFSKQEAISISTKIRHLKSTKNSQSVIDLLRTYNLSETQVKSIVLAQPKILLRKVDKTLKPKFKILSEIGLSGSDLAFAIKRDPGLLGRGLHTSMIPAFRFFRELFDSNDQIVKFIKRAYWPVYGKFFRHNVLLLEKFGISKKDIQMHMIRNPRMLTMSPERLEEKLNDLESKFGITHGSKMFLYGLSTLRSMNRSSLQKKFEVLRSFGWSDSDINTIAKGQPVLFTHSEERIRKGLDFFMVELGYTPSWLATRGSILMYSMEKRVKPRYQVFKVLKEKGVITYELRTILSFSEVDFLSRSRRGCGYGGEVYIPTSVATAICLQNKSHLLKKFELFKWFGWCDSDIYAILSKGFHGRISKQCLLNSSTSFFLRLLHSSITDDEPHLMVDYLIHSLNFSKQEAISTSTKIHYLKSTKNSQSVIDFLRNHNVSDADIKFIVLSEPRILQRNVDKTLKPKFKLFLEIGLSDSDLVAVIKKDPRLLDRGLHTSIIPTIRLLRDVFGTNDQIVKFIKRSYLPICGKSFRHNVVLLEKFGISKKDMQTHMIRNPRMLNMSPKRLEEKINELESKFGITQGSTMFLYGLTTLCSQNGSILQKKFEVLRSFGWSDSDINTIAKRQPMVLSCSEERLRKGLDFFMVELGYEPSWLATRGSVLMYSLEKRVKPRYQVFKVLKEKGVMAYELYTILCFSEVDFLRRGLGNDSITEIFVHSVHGTMEGIPGHAQLIPAIWNRKTSTLTNSVATIALNIWNPT